MAERLTRATQGEQVNIQNQLYHHREPSQLGSWMVG